MYTCIPLSVYQANKGTIDALVSGYDDNKVKNDTAIREYCVDLYADQLDDDTQRIEYGYHTVFIPDIEYTSDAGAVRKS